MAGLTEILHLLTPEPQNAAKIGGGGVYGVYNDARFPASTVATTTMSNNQFENSALLLQNLT